mmetsp:Transcript_16730/g.24797  ORF Transcript_16730/g.24797 Transcript_16730/m.24797 type:complete len:246 (-) Transcript_16730:726-1463(-)
MYDARNDTIQLGPAPEQKYVEGQIIQHQILLSSVINHDERIFGKFHRTDEKFNERRVTTHPNQVHTACTLVQVHDGQGWCDTNTSGKGYNIVEINSGSKGAEVRTVYPNGAGCGTNDGLVQLFRPVTQCCNAHGRGILLRWVWKYTESMPLRTTNPRQHHHNVTGTLELKPRRIDKGQTRATPQTPKYCTRDQIGTPKYPRNVIQPINQQRNATQIKYMRGGSMQDHGHHPYPAQIVQTFTVLVT